MGAICESVVNETCSLPQPRNSVRGDWKEHYYESRTSQFEAARSYLETTIDGTAIIDGPMGAGKSLFALALGEHFEEQGLTVMYSRSWVDTRTDTIWSRNGSKHKDVTWRFEFEDDDVLCNPDVLIIEEAHFIGFLEGQEYFLEKLIEVIQARREQGKRTIVAMLDETFLAEKWSAYERVLREIHENGGQEFRLQAICMECGEPAEHSQRLSDDAHAVQIGGDKEYEARCSCCHTEIRKHNMDYAEA